MLTEKVLVVSLTPLVVSAPLKAHPTSPPAQASLPRMELRSGTRKGNSLAHKRQWHQLLRLHSESEP